MSALTKAHTASVAQALDARDRRLRDEIREALIQSGDQNHIDLAGQVHDIGDESVANQLLEVENQLVERHLQELRELALVRERLARGESNECIECGGEIGVKRLLVNPAAVRCVGCQDRLEKAHSHEGMPRV